MENYVEFIEHLRYNISSFPKVSKKDWNKQALLNVDGLAGQELRRLVDLESRRDSGAFFTESKLADSILKKVNPKFTKDSFVYDAACGAGNLLISVQNYMYAAQLDPVKQLAGTDIHSEFVEAAKLRLLTNALLNNKNATDEDFQEEKKKRYLIEQANGLENNRFYAAATHVFVNPPFNQLSVKEKLTWAQGKISAAAIFLDKITQYVKPGTTIIAILPDVLRSGTRYEKWRKLIEERCSIENIDLLGTFDKFADVDVYMIHLTKRSLPLVKIEASLNDKPKQTLEDIYDICVGPVVDNRDEKKGPYNDYIVSRGLKGWSVLSKVSKKRRHEGKSFEGPFVVVKRTSRKEDTHRAVATIIHTHRPSYVDNHLIILKPKSRLLRDCKKALVILEDKRTDEWLNERIRCRHLTVKLIKEIPLWK